MRLIHIIERLRRKVAQQEFRKNHFKAIGSDNYVGLNCSFRSPENISIASGLRMGDNCALQTWPVYRGESTGNIPCLMIGNSVSFMNSCQISCMNRIEIGDGCLFGDNVFITDNYHGANSAEELSIRPIERKLFSKGEVIIGKNVWIGRNVCIMPAVKIGDGAIVAANAVVTKDIPANTIAAGVPARVIRTIK